MNINVNTPIVLLLNRNWQPIGHKTIAQAFTSLMGGNQKERPALALDISYALGSNGGWDTDNPLTMNPLKWDDWLSVPIRDGLDLVINSASPHPIRVPTVIIATRYADMPRKYWKPNKANVIKRDGGVCQYTGKLTPRDKGNIDHIVPLSRGGTNTMENMVWCDKRINTLKGNKSNQEAGLTLIRKAVTPKPVPISALLTDIRHADWTHFVSKGN